MGGKIFDTNKLIKQWKQLRKKPFIEYDTSDVESWAGKLIGIHQTNLFVTSVYLESVCGATDRREMELAKAYLNVFLVLDEGDIRSEDWSKARQLAERVPLGCAAAWGL